MQKNAKRAGGAALSSDLGLANESFNMFQLYDKYAEFCFVWETEGCNFRQQMGWAD